MLAMAIPFVNSALAAHPAFQHSVTVLRHAGTDVIHGARTPRTTSPGTGGSKFDAFPWHQALNDAEAQRHLRDPPRGQQQDAPSAEQMSTVPE